MFTVQVIDKIGRRENTTVATATTQEVFDSVTTAAPSSRQAVLITNHHASDDLYVRLGNFLDSAPAITSTNHDYVIAAGEAKPIHVGLGVRIWIESGSAGDVTYTAVELL
jgi:hypothetical protein